jgi:hypothetical protein
MKEKKARVEDALHATRAAIEEGIVPGGGVALVRCIQELDDYKLEGDEQIGVDIVKRAMEEPLRQIMNNAGEEGAIVLGKERESKNPNFGYNAQTGQFEDLVQAGVIDPTKVVRTALQNAGSISSRMLTTEALVAEIPEEKKTRAGTPRTGRHVLTRPQIQRRKIMRRPPSKIVAAAEPRGSIDGVRQFAQETSDRGAAGDCVIGEPDTKERSSQSLR